MEQRHRTATETSFRRIRIEMIRREPTEADRLRVTIPLGNGHNVTTEVPRSGSETDAEMFANINYSLAQEFGENARRWLMQEIQSIVSEYGGFDNTGHTPRVARWRQYYDIEDMDPIIADSVRPIQEDMIRQYSVVWQEAHRDMLRRMVERMGISPEILMQGQDWRTEEKPDREERAMQLLEGRIGSEKAKSLREKGYFEEPGKDPAYTLRFHRDTQGGVTLIERKVYGSKTRVLKWTLCVQSQAPDLPAGDVILSRWMEWKVDEARFLDTANFRAVETIDEATQMRQDVSDALLGTSPLLLRGEPGRLNGVRFRRYESPAPTPRTQDSEPASPHSQGEGPEPGVEALDEAADISPSVWRTLTEPWRTRRGRARYLATS